MSEDKNMIGPMIGCVIGWPIGQSLSPMIHQHWLDMHGIDGVYEAVGVPTDNLESQIVDFKANGLKGMNVTVPHKVSVAGIVDKLAPTAQVMGAVNTVKFNDDGTLSGFNTDGIGLMMHLKASVPDYPKDKPALIIGAGGAARAALAALVQDDFPFVMIANRTREKAETLASEIGRGRANVVNWEDRETAVAAAGLIINTTVLGMVGQRTLDLDLSSAASDTVVYDIVYKPLETDLLARARAQGLRTVDGLGMLVYQAAAAFKIFFDKDAPYDEALRAKLLSALGEEK